MPRKFKNLNLVTKEYVDSLVNGIDWDWMMKMKERQWKIEKILKRNESRKNTNC